MSHSEKNWQFAPGDYVEITVSGEQGLVVGRAEYLSHEDSYLVRYMDSTGCAREAWWDADALVPHPGPVQPAQE